MRATINQFQRSGAAVVVAALALAVLTGLGVYFGGKVVAQTYGWLAARSYVAVAAEVTAASVTPATPQWLHPAAITGNFGYTYNEVQYTGARLTINDFGDAYRRGLYHSLYAAKTLENPVTLWIDPQQPQKAIYDRQFRWTALAVLLPAALLCLCLATVLGLYLLIVLQERPRAGTDPAAERGPLSISTRSRALPPLLLAILLILYAWPVTLLSLEASSRFGEPASSAPYLIACIALALIGWAWWVRYAERALGRTVLKLNVLHQADGSAQLQGRIVFDPPLGEATGAHPERQQMTITLRCEARERSIPATNWMVLNQQVAGGSRWLDLATELKRDRDLSDRWVLVLKAERIERRFVLPASEVNPA